MAGNLLSDGAIRTLRQVVARVLGTKSARKQGPPHPFNSDSPDWFLARITGWSAIIPNARWRYAWEELLLETDNDFPYGGGLTGTTTDFYALNLREMNNITHHTGTQGNSINQLPPYPTNFHLLPVGGGTGGVVGNQVVVLMRIIVDTLGVGRPVFEYENADFGSC